MITVRGRSLVIPIQERQIGTEYDDAVETRVFWLDRFRSGGIDISHLGFRIDLEYANEKKDTCLLDKEILEDGIRLTWQIPSSSLQDTGTVWVSIRGIDENGTMKWASNRGALYVGTSVNTPSSSGPLTELEQIETELQKVQNNLDAAVNAMNGRVEDCEDQVETSLEQASQALGAAQSAIQQAAGSVKEAEAWAHGRDDFPERKNDNAMYWSGKAQEHEAEAKNQKNIATGEADRATNEADRAAMYADFVEPDFLLEDNRLYIKGGNPVEFCMADNKLCFKLA